MSDNKPAIPPEEIAQNPQLDLELVAESLRMVRVIEGLTDQQGSSYRLTAPLGDEAVIDVGLSHGGGMNQQFTPRAGHGKSAAAVDVAR